MSRSSSTKSGYVETALAVDPSTHKPDDSDDSSTANTLSRLSNESDSFSDEKLDSTLHTLAQHGFTMIPPSISSGVTGIVAFFTYSGTDENIKRLIKNEKLILKLFNSSFEKELDNGVEKNEALTKSIAYKMRHAEITYVNEWHNIQLMNLKRREAKTPTTKLPLVEAIQIGGIKIIANECIYHGDIPKNAEQYMRELGHLHSRVRESQKSEVTETIGKMDTIFLGTLESLEQLHQLQILHLDLTPKNVAICDDGAVVVDLGSSREFNASGRAIEHIQFPLKPIYSYNSDTIKRINQLEMSKIAFDASTNQESSSYAVDTDLFSFKIFLLDNLAHYCGVDQPFLMVHQMGLPGELVDLSDDVRLNNSISNLKDIIRKQQHNIRGTIASQVLEKYTKILLAEIQGDTPEAKWKNFKKLFHECAHLTATASTPLAPLKNYQPTAFKPAETSATTNSGRTPKLK